MKESTRLAQTEWPESLDALIAAPDHHKLLFENDRVRVLDTCIPTGDRTLLFIRISGPARYMS